MAADAESPKSSTGFAPIVGADPTVLILGSLPGVRSIEAGEYYAHARNAFWPIMRKLYGVEGGYAERCAQLTRHGVAVWDVLRSSVRPGSLDADIQQETAQPNDFAEFFSTHSSVARIGFNGRKAEDLYRRLVLPKLNAPSHELVSLPSTSPAHAAMSFDKKLEVWRSMLAADTQEGKR